jgi:ubiquinone/menaquinone biosynthesis C-methylase UbiE
MAQYTLGQDGAEEFERARLALLEEVHDPYTVRQFDAIGVSEGWRCVDVGAGAGSATRLLAARVGDTGSVVSLDLDVRLLQRLASDRVQVRRHDAVSDPLPEAAFDLVLTWTYWTQWNTGSHCPVPWRAAGARLRRAWGWVPAHF